ncbi:MAG: PAS domain S-box protein [Verrucomicrobiota bacterium]|nr:PAS domain S-box protein [Verrucomicrobiota bacterium]
MSSIAGSVLLSSNSLERVILNALPAQVAAVDFEGKIIFANLSWTSSAPGFENSNPLSVGANYLQMCDVAEKNGHANAGKIAKGLRSLLAGTQQSLSWEVEMGSMGKWFRVVMTALQADGTSGALLMYLEITEQKLAERAFQQAEEKYRGIFENASEGIFQSTLEGKYLSANPALARMLGYESPAHLMSELKSMPQDLCIHPSRCEEMKQELLTTGFVKNFESEVKHRDGHTIWVITNARLVRGSSGEPLYFEGTNTEITSRKDTEQTLARERNLLRTLLDHIPDYIYVKDLKSRHLANNRANLNLLGAHTQEETLGKTVMDYFPPQLAEAYLKDDQAVMSSGTPLIGREEVILDSDGSQRWLLTSKIPLRDSSGKITGLVGISRDITEQKRAESEIKKLAAFPTFNPNPVFEFGPDGALLYFNKAAVEMASGLGCAHPQEMLPHNFREVVEDCLAHNRNRTRLETVIEKRILSWSFFPILTTHVVHCYGGDITERHNLEAQLRQSQKMESIGQLAGGVAHDFNNLLTIIQGHAALLGLRRTNNEEADDSVRQISAAAERAANLTRQLLMFSRRQIMQTRILDINEVVGNMSKMLRRLLGEDVLLQVQFASALPLVKADPGMIEQVLMNLAVNSRDAMPKGGQLNISTKAVEFLPGCETRNPQARAGVFVCLTVSDTGTGIPREILPRIFEPFFTTKELGKGTGLGLATVYGIVQQHTGWIQVTSNLGKGTSFDIYIPADHSGLVEEKTKPGNETAPRGNETVLVVEDEGSLRALVLHVLKQCGYQILEAASGPQAIQIARSHQGPLHLVLTDLVMPGGMSGREMAEEIKRIRPETKLIYTSGYSAEILRQEGELIEGLNFVPKPYAPIVLAKAVRNRLDS